MTQEPIEETLKVPENKDDTPTRFEHDPTLRYTQYLRLDKVLTAQYPRSGEHDEMLFIVMHQIYELWFKQVLHELAYVQAQLEAGNTSHVLRGLHRTLSILRTVVGQLNVLETMTPTQFVSFRDWLAASSGYESAQFREVEAVLGRRDKGVADRYRPGSPERERITDAMSRPAVFDSFVRYLETQGYQAPTEMKDRDVRLPLEPSPRMQELLVRVYRDDGPAVGVCERLVDLDEDFQEWRYHHAKMVERTLGGKPGTAGSTGSVYLKGTVGKPAFPDLWAVRDLL